MTSAEGFPQEIDDRPESGLSVGLFACACFRNSCKSVSPFHFRLFCDQAVQMETKYVMAGKVDAKKRRPTFDIMEDVEREGKKKVSVRALSERADT